MKSTLLYRSSAKAGVCAVEAPVDQLEENQLELSAEATLHWEVVCPEVPVHWEERLDTPYEELVLDDALKASNSGFEVSHKSDAFALPTPSAQTANVTFSTFLLVFAISYRPPGTASPTTSSVVQSSRVCNTSRPKNQDQSTKTRQLSCPPAE